MKKYFITLKAKATLTDALEGHLPEKSASETIIKSGGVWLNNKRIFDPGRTVHKGETLTVFTSSDQGRKYRLPAEHIIHENQDFLAVYKPTNINVQADYAAISNNLTYGVTAHLKSGYEATAITRLDYIVQGLVLFAKNKNSEKELFRLSRQGKIKKQYLALLDPGQNIKRLRMKDVLGFRKKALLARTGKSAHSLFILKEQRQQTTVYSVFTFSGRRHQIRFHAAHYITPIIGDRLYGSACKTKNNGIGLIACGYNIPYRGKRFRIRLPDLGERIEKIEQSIV